VLRSGDPSLREIRECRGHDFHWAGTHSGRVRQVERRRELRLHQPRYRTVRTCILALDRVIRAGCFEVLTHSRLVLRVSCSTNFKLMPEKHRSSPTSSLSTVTESSVLHNGSYHGPSSVCSRAKLNLLQSFLGFLLTNTDRMFFCFRQFSDKGVAEPESRWGWSQSRKKV
jgi:hypothetical protein